MPPYLPDPEPPKPEHDYEARLIHLHDRSDRMTPADVHELPTRHAQVGTTVALIDTECEREGTPPLEVFEDLFASCDADRGLTVSAFFHKLDGVCLLHEHEAGNNRIRMTRGEARKTAHALLAVLDATK